MMSAFFDKDPLPLTRHCSHARRLLANIRQTKRKFLDSSEASHYYDPNNTNLHLLIPSSNVEVNLCKTLLGASVLDYPTPTILAWGERFDVPNELGGGSHIAKISRVLDYVNGLKSPEQEHDLVFMIDAYDIWFQLRMSTLISRYNRLIKDANQRLSDRLGGAFEAERLRQSILFASGKRCAPNQPHTIACYPIPDPPTDKDLYGSNTDTVIGRNKYSSNRQRYLNSGYILGPVKDVRRLFEAAWERAQNHPDFDPEDSGTHGSDFMYHGSDQSIFNALFGEQEYMREVLRLRHVSWSEYAMHPFAASKPATSSFEGAPVDNVLHPSFTHEEWSLAPEERDNPLAREYGMFLDYSSDVGHQSVNSEEDARWLHFNEKPLESQVQGRNRFDCKMHLPKTLPADITRDSSPPFDLLDKTLEMDDVAKEKQLQSSSWEGVDLYTHLCFGTVPVLVHWNGDKSRRESDWNRVWYQSRGREFLAAKKEAATQTGLRGSFEEHKARPHTNNAGGAWNDKKEYMSWEQLCPKDWDGMIFGR